MSEIQHVFRCDFCGQLADLDDGRIFFEPVEHLDDGSIRYNPAVYCSGYCGRTATSRSGSGRG